MNKKVLMIVGQVVVLAAAVGGTWWFMRPPPGTGPAVAGEGGAPEPTVLPVAREPIYYSLEPAFVVNLQDGRSMRFLQVQVDLMSRHKKVIELLETYSSRIRNDLIMLFSSANRDAIRTAEGREALQQEALNTVNKVLMDETGMAGIEAVYFTKFVMQ